MTAGRQPRIGAAGTVDALLALVVGVLVLAASLVWFPVMSLPAGWTVAVTAAFVVLHATVALRRTAPRWGFGLANAAMLVIAVSPPTRLHALAEPGVSAIPVLFLPSSMVYLPALYAASARSGRRAAAGILAVAVTGSVLAGARIDPTDIVGAALVLQYRVYLTFALVAAVTAAWGLGVGRAVREEREAGAQAEATRTAVLADRAEIARDMHDVVSHSLAVIVRQAEGGAAVAARSPERAEQVLRTIAGVGRDALTDMRGMVDVLRGPEPPRGPAPNTAPLSLDDLPAVLDRVRGTGVGVTLRETGSRYEIGPAAQLAAYHVVRETLTNVVKHAGASSRVRIDLEWASDVLHLVVRDDGGGASSGGDGASGGGSGGGSSVPGAGSGLAGLAERVAAAGGTFSAEPDADGFVVRAGFPRRNGRSGR
jgi:signal transduction histidine kinase